MNGRIWLKVAFGALCIVCFVPTTHAQHGEHIMIRDQSIGPANEQKFRVWVREHVLGQPGEFYVTFPYTVKDTIAPKELKLTAVTLKVLGDENYVTVGLPCDGVGKYANLKVGLSPQWSSIAELRLHYNWGNRSLFLCIELCEYLKARPHQRCLEDVRGQSHSLAFNMPFNFVEFAIRRGEWKEAATGLEKLLAMEEGDDSCRAALKYLLMRCRQFEESPNDSAERALRPETSGSRGNCP